MWRTFLLIASSLIALAQTAVVVGVVQDQTAAVIVGANVGLSGNGLTRTARTEVAGFVFRDLPAGDYTLTVDLDGFLPRREAVSLADGQRLDLKGVTLEVVPFPGGGLWRILDPRTTNGELAGSVVREDRVVAKDATVSLRCEDSVQCGLTTRSGKAEFRFVDLPPGPYELRWVEKGSYPEELHIKVVSGMAVEYNPLWLERCVEPTCNPANQRPRIYLE